MAKIKLRDYQVEAVNFTQRVDKSLLCMRVGSGKTICAMFALREFLNNKRADKAIVACTKSSVSVFQHDFKEKAGIKVPLAETIDDLMKFLSSRDSKICLIKHSMFEKAGGNIEYIRELEEYAKKGLKVALVIDEAHKMQNPEGVAQSAFHRIDFLFNKVVLLTATPYSSCLSQFWGLICLIHPEVWPTKRSFFNRFIDEVAIKDPKTFRIIRKEKVRYKNLAEFREAIEPFTYFYYPKIALVHIEHHTRLKDYSEYNTLCQGILTEEEKEALEKKKQEKSSR